MSFTTRIRRALADAAYGQKRLLELRTGLTLTGARRPSATARAQIAELEATPVLAEVADRPEPADRPGTARAAA